MSVTIPLKIRNEKLLSLNPGNTCRVKNANLI